MGALLTHKTIENDPQASPQFILGSLPKDHSEKLEADRI